MGPCGGVKRSISFNFNYKVSFKDFYTKLCVCSHKLKIQNKSGEIFIMSPGSPGPCPRDGTLGRWGCPGGLYFSNMVMWYIKSTGWRAEQNASKMFILGSNWWPWGWGQRSNIIKFRLPCQFQWFFYTKLCVRVCYHKWKIQNMSDGIFILSPGSCPGVGLWGTEEPRGSNNFVFKHCHVAYQIDGDAWRAEQNASDIFILGSNWWPCGEVKR